MVVENEFLKKQVHQLKSQIDKFNDRKVSTDAYNTNTTAECSENRE